MSKQTLRSAFAIAGLISAAAMVTVPQLATAQPAARFVHAPPVWSVTCADGSIHFISSGVKPAGNVVCASIGYNGGAIVSDPATTEASVRHDAIIKDLQVAQDGEPLGTLDPSSVDTAVQADAMRGDPVRPGGKPGLPTLTCSNSPVKPAALNLSTGPTGWSLSAPGGSGAALNSASNISWSAVPGGQWVGPGGSSAAVGVWTYSRQVGLLRCPKGRPAKLSIAYRADNGATFRVKDASGTVLTTANQGGTPNYGFLPASLTNHSYTFPVGAAGIYTIVFEVRNSGGPTGLSARVNLTR